MRSPSSCCTPAGPTAPTGPLAPALATGPAGPRRVYAPDLRGHGRSDWPGGYAYETMRDDIHALLGALGIERADVVGHSLGGAVACLLAQRSPGLERLLVLEDVPAPFPLAPPRPPAERPSGETPYDWAMILATDGQRTPRIPCPTEFLATVAEFLSPAARTRS